MRKIPTILWKFHTMVPSISTMGKLAMCSSWRHSLFVFLRFLPQYISFRHFGGMIHVSLNRKPHFVDRFNCRCVVKVEKDSSSFGSLELWLDMPGGELVLPALTQQLFDEIDNLDSASELVRGVLFRERPCAATLNLFSHVPELFFQVFLTYRAKLYLS